MPVEPPYKKIKTDDKRSAAVINFTEQDNVSSCAESTVWIKIDGHLLTSLDEIALLKNKKLNDRHINLPQRLMSKQFPDIEGLYHTIFKADHPLKALDYKLFLIEGSLDCS